MASAADSRVWAAQVLPGDAPQFRVNEGHQAAERLLVSFAPRGDQSADVARIPGGHAGADAITENSSVVTLFSDDSRNT